VDECIQKYIELSKDVFRIDNVIKGIPVGVNQCRFNEEPLEKALKNVINDKLGDANATMADPDYQHPDFCPVFVVATEGQDAGGPEKLFRSYGFYRDQCPIWQAGRATSAAPSFFKPAFVQVPLPGGWYIDGGVKRNNPSEVALNEARKCWKTLRRFSIVSIGTGIQTEVDFIGNVEPPLDDGVSGTGGNERQDLDQSTRGDTLSRFKSAVGKAIPKVAEVIGTNVSNVPFASNAAQLARVPGGVITLARFAKELAKLSTEAEDTHRKMLAQANADDVYLRFPYYRFNVQGGMEGIGLEEWEKVTKMGALTRGYLSHPSTQADLEKCSEKLLNPDAVERT
jgi:predicted acylesterase/phospholipase RssA